MCQRVITATTLPTRMVEVMHASAEQQREQLEPRKSLRQPEVRHEVVRRQRDIGGVHGVVERARPWAMCDGVGGAVNMAAWWCVQRICPLPTLHRGHLRRKPYRPLANAVAPHTPRAHAPYAASATTKKRRTVSRSSPQLA